MWVIVITGEIIKGPSTNRILLEEWAKEYLDDGAYTIERYTPTKHKEARL